MRTGTPDTAAPGKQQSEVAVVVCSCDKYADAWSPFFTLFFRYWPDCPAKIFLITNELSFDHRRVTSLRMGPDVNWSRTFANALRLVESRLVVVLMEDYLLFRPIDNGRIQSLIDVMTKMGAACMRLYPDPGGDVQLTGAKDVCLISERAEFRVSLQAALWDREALIGLVKDGENAWDFEIKGTERSRHMLKPFLSVCGTTKDAALPYYCTGIVRGKWMPGAVLLCRKEGIDVDLKARPCAWLRGWIREQPVFLSFRRIIVRMRRAMGIN